MSKVEELSQNRYPTWAEKYAFIDGYEQAEKDLALTVKDIEKIHIFLYAVKNNKQGVFTLTKLSDEQYQEVLNRFNKKKKSKNEWKCNNYMNCEICKHYHVDKSINKPYCLKTGKEIK